MSRARWFAFTGLGAALFLTTPFANLLPTGGLTTAQQVNGGREKTDQLSRLINRERVEAGRLPLARSAELDEAARQHSRDMAERDFLEHEGSDGSTPGERAERAGYRVPANSGWLVVEVISAISDQPEGPLKWWLEESPRTHGRHLLDPRYREMGVGYASGGTYGNYWTVLVGCRPGIVPTVEFEGQTYRHDEECDEGTAAQLQPTPSPTADPTRTATPVPTRTPTSSPTPRPIPRLQVAELQATPGTWITVRWADIPRPAAADWIGFYRVGDPADAHLGWFYVNCASRATSPSPVGACSFLVPDDAGPGAYELRLFANDSYSVLANSPIVNIREP